MKLFGRKRYELRQQQRAAQHAELMADHYRHAFDAGRKLCQRGGECPSDRPQFPVTVWDAQAAGWFDGWVACQCEIFDETDEGIRAIEEHLRGVG